MIKHAVMIGEGYIVSLEQVQKLFEQNRELYYDLIEDKFFYPINHCIDSPFFFGNVLKYEQNAGTYFNLDILPKTDSATMALIAYGYRHYFGQENEPSFSRYCLVLTYDTKNSELNF